MRFASLVRPIVAAVLDGLFFLCLTGALWFVVTGSLRTIVDGDPLTVKWSDAIVAALAVAILRHTVLAKPSLWTTIRRSKAWIASRPELAEALLALGLTRITVLLVGLIAVTAVGFPPESGQLGSGREAVPGLLARFDGTWYAGIAASGYDWDGTFDRQQNVAFFPALPMLMRGIGTLTGAMSDKIQERRLFRLTTIGLAISLTSFVWASWLFARLARELLDDVHARWALWLLTAYPFAVFFNAAYTESLYLLSALGAWHSIRHQKFVSGSLWGLLAGLARPNGFFLSVALGLIVMGFRDGVSPTTDNTDRVPGVRRVPELKYLAVALMPVVGMLGFTTYLYGQTGEWFLWARMHAAWGRTFSGEVPLTGVVRSTNSLLDLIVMRPYDAMNLLGLVFPATMLWSVWRLLGPPWVAFILINTVPPLFAGGLMSMGRLSATMFPLFLALAGALPPRSIPAVVVAFAMMQGLVAVLFFTWRSVY